MDTLVAIMFFLFAVGLVRDFPYPRPVHRKATSWNMLVDGMIYLNDAVIAGWFTYYVWRAIPALSIASLQEGPVELIVGWLALGGLSLAIWVFAFMAFCCFGQIYENWTGSQFTTR